MFDRWNNYWGRSRPYRTFNEHHAQLNDFYWSHRAAVRLAEAHFRQQALGMSTEDAFQFGGDDARRLPSPLSTWHARYKDFQNWVRLSCALSLASYLEIYLRAIASLAVESAPGILIGARDAVDGLVLLKNRSDYSQSSSSTPLVTGTWQKRLIEYEKLFGSVPQELSSKQVELEKFRKMRNSVGHYFGRDVNDNEDRARIETKSIQRLSENRFKEWMNMVDKVVLAVDEHLCSEFIGEYDFLKWGHEQSLFSSGYDLSSIRKKIGQRYGRNPPASYIQGARDYYDSV